MTLLDEPPPTPTRRRSAAPTRPRAAALRVSLQRRVHAGPPTALSTVVAWATAVLSLLAVWTAFFALVLSGLQEGHEQHNAYTLLRERLSKQTAPLGGAIRPGAPVALLDAPALGLKQVVVVEGTASSDLFRGPGHRRDTPLPGQAGVSLVYGRATLFGGPFGDLAGAAKGAQIRVTTGQGEFTYVVDSVRRVGDPYPQPLQPGAGRLTLVTASGASASNLWQPTDPLYVDATLQGKAQPAPAGRPAAVPQAEKAMRGDIGALFPLVLWIPLLLLAGVLTVWAAERWGRWQAWLAGAPVILAVLWGTSETAVRLLPNLL